MVFGLLVTTNASASKARTAGGSNELAVDICDGYLIVAEANVGELHGLRFLVDTGTSITAIDRRLAKRLGVLGQPTKVLNFDKTISVESGQVPEITYGSEEASDVRVLIEDLRYLRPGGAPVDGIIGLDLLHRKNFLVDYARKRVVFGAMEGGGMRTAPLRAGGTELCVEAELDGRLVWMIADTGMAGTVLYERGREASLENYTLRGQAMVRSLSGAVESRKAVVSRFRLGGQDIERRVLLVSAPNVKRLNDIAGYLGPAMLDAKQIVFDFDSNQFRWKK
jgi:predicted aspartyl protease